MDVYIDGWIDVYMVCMMYGICIGEWQRPPSGVAAQRRVGGHGELHR